MHIGIIGLGRMGFSMALRLIEHGHTVVGYNRTVSKTKALEKKGGVLATSIPELIEKLGKKKRVIWLMLPAGKVTDDMIDTLLPLLAKGDIIVNGANAFYKEAQAQAKRCERYGVHFFDAGVSGGIWGLERGYALMIGGPKRIFKSIEPVCKALAPKDGYGYVGESGMGHYTKSVHNIVEYVMMEGIAEGVELLDKKKIDYKKALKVWQPASIVSGSLLDWTVDALNRKDFKKLKTDIDSVTIGELTDTVNAVDGFAPAFDKARRVRCCTPKGRFDLGKRVIVAIRREFGGHAVKK